ncbi:MAG: hypothetical protein N2383_03355 [Caldilineales bacterium]|nr:hypothetical protein [Caldilineales bacterium]
MSAYAHGRLAPPPDLFLEIIVIPAILHTPWALFRTYPPAVQLATKHWLLTWLAAGQGMNTDVIYAQ